jgi:hypothetical protein
MKKLLIYLALILLFSETYGQINYPIRHSSPVFGFDLPITMNKSLDTLGMLLYFAESNDSTQFIAQLTQNDSSFISQLNEGVSPQDSGYIQITDSVSDPLYVHRIMFANLYDSTSEIYYTEVAQLDTSIKCGELGMLFFDYDGLEKEMFARIYYNGHDIYTFILIGLKRRETDLSILKNNFFNSIFIN